MVGRDTPRSDADAYGPYFQSVKGRLPAAVVRLRTEVSLHDAMLRSRIIDCGSTSMQMKFDGYVWVPGRLPDAEQRIVLQYAGVTDVQSERDPSFGLGGPHGYGDMGYDEVELLDGDLVEHRMLFSTGIELRVRFADRTMEEQPSRG